MTTQGLLNDADLTLQRAERAIERRIGMAREIKRGADQKAVQARESEQYAEACTQANAWLTTFADERADEVRRTVEGLVTHGLRAVFGEELTFEARSVQRAKRAEMDFVVISQAGGQLVETAVMDARGGGVAAVAGFLLRLVVLMLREDCERILFLDEPFAHVSDEYQPAMAEFVRELVERTDVQVVLVTHADPDTWVGVADRAYQTSVKNGWTTLTELS